MACTGIEFCKLAIVETKIRARDLKRMKLKDKEARVRLAAARGDLRG